MAVILLLGLRRTQIIVGGSSSGRMIGLAVFIQPIWSGRLRRRRALAHVLVLRPTITTSHGIKISCLNLGPQRTRHFSVADFTECIGPSGPVVRSVVVSA